MTNGEYETKCGSRVTMGGNGQCSNIVFEWFDEERACFDCNPYVEDDMLIWDCDYCGGGSAELFRAGDD